MDTELVVERFAVLPENLQVQVIDYIEFLIYHHDLLNKKSDEVSITNEQKEILSQRLEMLKNDTSDEREQESEIVKKRIREKFNFKQDVV